ELAAGSRCAEAEGGLRAAVETAVSRPWADLHRCCRARARGSPRRSRGCYLFAERSPPDGRADARRVLPHGWCRVTYTLDTNILIGLVQRYPRDIFPAMWSNIESSVQAGDSCICEAILREVHRGGDDLHKWAKDLPGFVCPATDGELEAVAEIAVAHPGWVQ